jgi:hypothetical protein
LCELHTALLACDGVIISGTTYMWSLNAAMKNLLDHFAYMFHRPELFGKICMVVATSAGNGEKSVARYFKSVLAQWGVNGALVLTQNTKAQMLQGNGSKQSAKVSRAYDGMARKFYDLIKSGVQIPPSVKTLVVHNAFRVSSLSEFAEKERDIEFWNRPGFVDKPYPIKIGVGKTLFGKFVYSMANNATKLLGGMYKSNQK